MPQNKKSLSLPAMVLVCVLVCVVGVVVIAQEQITLTTYYPSPYGVYNKVRLYPSSSDFTSAACAPGELGYYNGSLYMCKDDNSWAKIADPNSFYFDPNGDFVFNKALKSTRSDNGWLILVNDTQPNTGIKWSYSLDDMGWYYNNTLEGFFDYNIQNIFGSTYGTNFDLEGGLVLKHTEDIFNVSSSGSIVNYTESNLCVVAPGSKAYSGALGIEGWVKQCAATGPWNPATSAFNIVNNATIGGSLGVGNNNPAYPLDISGRSQVRGTAAGGGGFWLTNPAGTVSSFMGRGTAAEPFTGIYSGAWNFMVYDAGDVGITNSMTWNNGKSSLNADQGGSIELGNGITAGAVPYIDFHYGTGAAQDYNMRIINEANGALAVYGGTLKVGNLAGVGSRNVVADASGILSAPVSSRRYKKDIVDLTADPGNALKLRPVRFKWKKDNSTDIGLIAEDVDQIIKDLVIYNADGKPEGVKYEKVPLYLLITIRDQQKQIEALKKQNDDISKRLESLERKQNR